MPLPPADKPSDSPANARPVVMLRSPRDAAQRAIVYRRRRAERPNGRALRIAGVVGTLLVHLLVLFGVILGSAYDYQKPPDTSVPLQVRLIDRPEPPPPPPVRGTPPKRIGPVHRGRAMAAKRSVTPVPPVPAAIRPDIPVITVTAPAATIRIAAVAAPLPPLAVPHPQHTADLAPVPLAGAPPQVNLDMPPTERPVPPKFQPEPVRKPQLEGNRPMSTPTSLAMPAVPAQAPPPIATPSIALDQVALPSPRPSPIVLEQPASPAAPTPPELEPIPLSAPAAPALNLVPQLSAPAPSVPRERPRVQAPTIRLAEPQLAAVPLTATAPPETAPPAIPAIEVSRPANPVASLVLARPEASAAQPAQAPQPGAAAAPAVAVAGETQAISSTDIAHDNVPSSAPDATPHGSDSGTPGAREATIEAAGTTSARGAHPQKTGPGNGQGEGKQGKAQPGAAKGAEHGRLGSYIQLKPHGDTRIMEHRAPDIGYKPTRFEGDWAPENESSIDTALRHAIEKTTIKKTIHLPRGVRIKCDFSVLRLFALAHCGNADPPAKGGTAKQYERLDLAPVRSLDPTPAASAAPTPAAPIHLDNAAQCAAARVSGGPLPPGCTDETLSIPPPARAPAAASSSWVPASDQFH